MKIRNKIFISLILITLGGCKVEEVISPDATFVEYTVVQAEIKPDKNFPSVRFTKTLPLGVAYDIKKAELKNVTAYIVKNGVQVIPLIYDVDGLYNTKYGLIVRAGETYELFALNEGKYIYSKTIIPYEPVISSVIYKPSEFTLNATLNTRSGEVYGAVWIISDVPPDTAKDFYSITDTSYGAGTEIIVQSGPLPENYRSPEYSDKLYIEVFSFDESFRKYFYSKTSGNEINDPFIQGGGLVEWNVYGDKVIGMFIGVTSALPVKVN